MDKISVIIPVYNVEKYLKKCLDSVINQTYSNIEIIIIDDGSPDNCGEICDEYAAKDSRINVIHKKNEGLCAARNDALGLVTGKWISFVDSDDWCELDMLEKAIIAGEKENADIVMYSIYRNLDNHEKRIQAFPNSFVVDDKEFIEGLQLSALNKKYTPHSQNWCQGFPWDKLFKTSLIKDNQLTFSTNVKANEDVIFNLHAFQYAKRVVYINEYLYHYRYNPNSIGTKYTPDRVQIDKDIYNEMFAIGGKYNLKNEYYKALDTRIVENAVALSERCLFHKENKKSFYEKCRYAKEVMASEPICSALKNVDKSKLGISAKIIAQFHKHNILLLYGYAKLKPLWRRIGG